MNVRSTRVEPETTVWGRARSVAPRSTNPRQTSPKRPRSTTPNPRTRPHAPSDGVALTRRVALLVQHAAGGTAIAHAPNKRSKATLSTTHETFASGASNPLTRDNSGSHTLAFDASRTLPHRCRPLPSDERVEREQPHFQAIRRSLRQSWRQGRLSTSQNGDTFPLGPLPAATARISRAGCGGTARRPHGPFRR